MATTTVLPDVPDVPELPDSSEVTPRRRPSEALSKIEVAALVLAVFLAFLPALSADFLNWDDNYTVVDNPQIRSLDRGTVEWAFTTFSMGHYQPLSWLSLALDHALWGLSPFGFHLSNLLLHAATAVLVLLLLRLVLSSFAASPLAGGAAVESAVGGRFDWVFWSALFWAVHPMRVESVVWVTERRDVLSGLLLVATVLAYLKARVGDGPDATRLRPLWWLLAIVLFATSLLAKAAGVVMPAVLLVLEMLLLLSSLLPPRSSLSQLSWRRTLSGLVVRLAPFAVLAGAAALVAPRAQAATRALVPLEVLSLGDRVVVAMYGWCYYLWRLFWPVDLSPLYELPLEVRWSEPRFLVAGLAVLAVACLMLGLLFVGMRSGGALRRTATLVLASAALYTCLLLPVLGFFQSGMQLVADRYSYLPSVVLAAVLAELLRRLFLARQEIARLLCAVFAVALMVATFNYSLSWRSSLELWQSAVVAQPECAFCREGLGTELLRSGDLEGAEAELTRVLEQRPNLPTGRRALATLYEKTGREREALREYQRALRLTPGDPALEQRIRELSEKLATRP